MTKALSIKDLQLIADEPRVQDVRIGERLGFDRPRKIRELIERNKEELETYGTLAPHDGAQLRENGATIAVDEFWLNEQQTLLLCMFSRTEKAAEVRREVISVYLAYRNGTPAPKQRITADDRDRMKLLEELAEARKQAMETQTRLYSEIQEQQIHHGKRLAALALVKNTDLANDVIAEQTKLHPLEVEYLRQMPT